MLTKPPPPEPPAPASILTAGQTSASTSVLVSEVNGPAVDAQNSFEHPDRVAVRERRVPATGPRLEHEFPAHPVTVLRIRLDG